VTPPTLEVRDLAIGYGRLSVAKGLSIRVEAGEIVALLGRNGVGKTTTLHTIAGIIPPLAGQVAIDGETVSGPLHRRARRSGVALVTEDRAVIRRLTVAENLRLGRGDVTVAFELFPELIPLRRKKAGLLSGGEQQMLVLGRCLTSNPRLLLVDELSLGLAPLVVQRLLRALRTIATERQVAVLLVEQHPSLALSMADFGHVFSRGQISLSGTGVDLRGRLKEIEQVYLSESWGDNLVADMGSN
jgi:branched-chain amino acid transport system ATP-binding protein